MSESEFDELLNRFERGLCTEQEKTQIQHWLDSMKEGASPFSSWAEKQNTKELLRQAIYRKARIPAARTIPLTPSILLKIAASILILVSLAYSLWYYQVINISPANHIAETSTADKAIEKILLADGSIVWLKPDSKLIYPQKFEGTERVVKLYGEALFEVAKDPSHPFIIHSGETTTKVLGTSFNIKNTIESTEIVVLTGKVWVTANQDTPGVELNPKEKIVYINASRELYKEQPLANNNALLEYTRGTNYNMVFENVTVREIAKLIKAKFNVSVTVDEKLMSCLITADLTDQSLQNTVAIIAEAINATYEIDGDEVALEGNGCE